MRTLAKTFWVVAFQLIALGAAFAVSADYDVYSKRYKAMGFEDPKKALSEALARPDAAWNEDIQLAKELYPQVVGQLKVSTDAKLQARVDRLMKKLIAQSARPTLAMRVVILESDMLNALTCGGNLIYVYTGILKSVPDDNGLAFVLAHEMSHAMARHGWRKVQLARKAALRTDLKAGERDLLNDLFSRITETEADALGVHYLKKAGFPVVGYTKVMEVFERFEPMALAWVRQQVDKAAKQIDTLRASCTTLSGQYRAQGTVEAYLKLMDEYEKLRKAHEEYDTMNAQWYQIWLSCVRTHPETQDRRATCGAMEKMLQKKGPTATEPVAVYVHEVIFKA